MYGAELGSTQNCYRTQHWIQIQVENDGHTIKGATQVLCNSKSVVLHTSFPSSMWKKKHNAIVYHWVREAVSASIVKVSHIAGTSKNRLCELFFNNVALRLFVLSLSPYFPVLWFIHPYWSLVLLIVNPLLCLNNMCWCVILKQLEWLFRVCFQLLVHYHACIHA